MDYTLLWNNFYLSTIRTFNKNQLYSQVILASKCRVVLALRGCCVAVIIHYCLCLWKQSIIINHSKLFYSLCLIKQYTTTIKFLYILDNTTTPDKGDKADKGVKKCRKR